MHTAPTSHLLTAAISGSLLLATVGVAACGSTVADDAVAQVGGATITGGALRHRVAVLAAGHSVDTAGRRGRELTERALESLIGSQWVIGEAADRGVGPSAKEVRRYIQSKDVSSFSGGAAELSRFLKVAGETIADLELEARTELAAAKLRSLVLASTPAVSEAQVLGYYRTHKRQYAVPARREIQITSRKTAREANRLMREVAAGRRFTDFSLRETRMLEGRHDAVLDGAIFAAKPGVLVGPVKPTVDYFVFEVTRALPASERTFAQVRGSIYHQLTEAARRRALTDFIANWRARWRARTDCRPGYVVQKCRQHAGPAAPEDPLDFR
ncbi:MAG TPA: peptidylprolyl isomerase [Solirubrobacteraceae bacterium]|nr:peptidylprolyl isomerase [Solirubrobacteraceae bacterium]